MNNIGVKAAKTSLGLIAATLPALYAVETFASTVPTYFRYGQELGAMGHIGAGAVAALVSAAILDKVVLNSAITKRITGVSNPIKSMFNTMKEFSAKSPNTDGYVLVGDINGEIHIDVLTRDEFELYKSQNDVTVISAQNAKNIDQLTMQIAEYTNGKIRNDNGPALSVFVIGKDISQIEIIKSMDSFITNIESSRVILSENKAKDLNFSNLARTNKDIVNRILDANNIDINNIKGVRSLFKFKRDVTKAIMNMALDEEYRNKVMNEIEQKPDLAPVRIEEDKDDGFHNEELRKEVDEIMDILELEKNTKENEMRM